MHHVEVEIRDSRGGAITREFDVTVVADTTDPVVRVVASADTVAVGGQVTIQVLSVDDVAIASTSVTVNGDPVILNASGSITLPVTELENLVIVATVLDSAGNDTVVEKTITVVDLSDVSDPVVAIASPEANDILTERNAISFSTTTCALSRAASRSSWAWIAFSIAMTSFTSPGNGAHEALNDSIVVWRPRADISARLGDRMIVVMAGT